jgi:RNA polymerase sigma factor (sigma-70 family)
VNETRVVNALRQFVAEPEDDADLLGRFLATRDAGAFAELVRRHGPMVLGVCRRVLGDGPDADDAFQAAFLVLARRGGSVRNGRSVASFLFGVARFAALRARDKARRRRAHESRAGRDKTDRVEPPADPELLAAVDEELHRLPDRYRAPLLACLLRGRTQEDAAREAGCSLSTLRRRLDRGLVLLRGRLTRRGAVPALGAVALGAGGAPVSAGAVEATTALVVAVLTGNSRAVPATDLAKGVSAMLGRTKRSAAAVAVLVAGVLGGGLAWQLAAAQPAGGPPDRAKAPAKPAEPPAKEPPAKAESAKPDEDRIKPGDRLKIRGQNLFDQVPLDEIFVVEPSGKIPLGPNYGGRVKIGGLPLEEAEAVIQTHIRQYASKAFITLVRHAPPEGELDARVQRLEREVKDLRALVEELRKQR